MEKQELKPCPFCGSTDIAIVKQDNPHNDYDGDYPYLYTAACKQCLSRSPQKVYEEYAAEAWNTRASGWIPCSEMLPEDKQKVLIHTKSKGHILIAEYNSDWSTPFYSFRIGGWKIRQVSHWMPLPEPPEDAE